jgi:hypothetical protein
MASNSTLDNLTSSSEMNSLASKFGITISKIAWEDTGRTKGSCFGPNISDMTLCVGNKNMPIIRKPNYSDVTSDQDISSFSVNVGNETGLSITSIPLKEYLQNITKYTDIKLKENTSLIVERDTHILTSAQACILPLKNGKVEFGVKLYNYQSKTSPAVLVLIVSAQGTSAHYVLDRDNTLDFNKNKLKAQFLAERLRDDREKRGVALDGAMTDEEKIRNALLIFQIPLKYIAPRSSIYLESYIVDCIEEGCEYVKESSGPFSLTRGRGRGMDHGILSTTDGRGKYTSLDKYTVERDELMPIRCTIQYYHVTDESTISETDMAVIASEVTRHNPISSLVVDITSRPTEHTVPDKPKSFIQKMFCRL